MRCLELKEESYLREKLDLISDIKECDSLLVLDENTFSCEIL